ncbi:carbohydrate ABC transporter permease [Nonomuraea zeae]|uniref:Carbohydrate ABC transporter permease n=1 Tax=Nonomuraea zeae TaxID=1642303 RepID=A0A5S4GFW3_9ACTN|nr:carbohydrate ABC transporter permease [Nonomuraea zeae]
MASWAAAPSPATVIGGPEARMSVASQGPVSRWRCQLWNTRPSAVLAKYTRRPLGSSVMAGSPAMVTVTWVPSSSTFVVSGRKLFVLMERLSPVNSLFGLFLLYVAVSLPFTVFLLTGYFASLPGELEEAAAIDGASRLPTFWTIMLPLARSGLITAFTLNAIGLWNEAFLALVFVQSTDKQTLPLALLGFLAKQQYSGADYGVLFAGVVIIVLPMLLLYVWLGRRIIEGMTLGAGK